MNLIRVAASLSVGLVLVTGCSQHGPVEADLFNRDAALPVTVQAMGWKTIASSVDRAHGTMSTLTGNDAAVARARAATAYGNGSVLALTTWGQREDPHWFGARIPGAPQTVEIVSMVQGADGKMVPGYRRYAGQPLREDANVDASLVRVRTAYILGQRVSWMP